MLAKVKYLIAILVLAFSASTCDASEVKLQVLVQERKSTDTINDFVFDGTIKPAKVLGATNERKDNTLIRAIILFAIYPYI